MRPGLGDKVEAQLIAAEKRGLLKAAEMAEERAKMLSERVSEMLGKGNYGTFGAKLEGGAVELEAQAARLRTAAEGE